MRKLLLAVLLSPLAACVTAPSGEYARIATIKDVRLDEVPGQPGALQVTVRGTPDGIGWSNAQLRLLPRDSAHPRELRVAMFARSPAGATRKAYDPRTAYGGDTYGGSDYKFPRNRQAIDTYYGHGSDQLEAHMILYPASDDQIVRVVGGANDMAGLVRDLRRMNADIKLHQDSFTVSPARNGAVIQIGPGAPGAVSWNGAPVSGPAELDSRMAALASRRNAMVSIVPVHDADPALVADVLRSARRFGVDVRRRGDHGFDDRYDDYSGWSENAPRPTEGFWFPKIH